MWKALCNEIHAFANVRAAWGLGPIRIKIEKCLLKHCPKGKVPGTKNKHMVVNGFYTQTHNTTQHRYEVFLGYGLNHAYYRINDVKRLLRL